MSPNLINLLKAAAVLAAASLLGNWFLREVRKAKRAGKPWYAPYGTPPGILVMMAVILPLIYWFFF
jgi:hypothetical protein